MNNFLRIVAKRWTALLCAATTVFAAALVVAWPRGAAKQVLVAARDVAEGAALTSADLTSTSVNLGNSQGLYLAELPAGAVALHRFVAGEFLTRDSVAPSATQTRLATVIEFHETLPSAIRVGALTDVWATPKLNQAAGEPVAVAIDCVVGSTHQSSGLGQHLTSVELLCSPEYLPQLMRSKAASETISLVPRPSLLDK